MYKVIRFIINCILAIIGAVVFLFSILIYGIICIVACKTYTEFKSSMKAFISTAINKDK